MKHKKDLVQEDTSEPSQHDDDSDHEEVGRHGDDVEDTVVEECLLDFDDADRPYVLAAYKEKETAKLEVDEDDKKEIAMSKEDEEAKHDMEEKETAMIKVRIKEDKEAKNKMVRTKKMTFENQPADNKKQSKELVPEGLVMTESTATSVDLPWSKGKSHCSIWVRNTGQPKWIGILQMIKSRRRA